MFLSTSIAPLPRAAPPFAPALERGLSPCPRAAISPSPPHPSPCSDYELDLRGHKIGTIENLGVTQNQFDCLDLSQNAIVVLDGFPRLPRLTTLLAAHNRIVRLAPNNLGPSLPALHTLILTANRLTRLTDLEPLQACPHLAHLSLVDNPVTKTKHYRLALIHLLPTLKTLDFRKVRPAERTKAAELFGGGTSDGIAALRALDDERRGEREKETNKTFVPGEGLEGEGNELGVGVEEPRPKRSKKGPTAEELTAIKAAIAAASTMHEVEELEAALQSGTVPAHLRMGGWEVTRWRKDKREGNGKGKGKGAGGWGGCKGIEKERERERTRLLFLATYTPPRPLLFSTRVLIRNTSWK